MPIFILKLKKISMKPQTWEFHFPVFTGMEGFESKTNTCVKNSFHLFQTSLIREFTSTKVNVLF